jgi:hypothetical protein
LKDYPPVVVGYIQAFKVEENTTGSRRVISYYPKDTWILVLAIGISYGKDTLTSVQLSPFQYNAISARPCWAFPGVKHSIHKVNIRFETETPRPMITPQQQDYTWPITIAVISVAITVAIFILLKRRK